MAHWQMQAETSWRSLKESLWQVRDSYRERKQGSGYWWSCVVYIYCLKEGIFEDCGSLHDILSGGLDRCGTRRDMKAFSVCDAHQELTVVFICNLDRWHLVTCLHVHVNLWINQEKENKYVRHHQHHHHFYEFPSFTNPTEVISTYNYLFATHTVSEIISRQRR